MNLPVGITNRLKTFGASLALALAICMNASGQSATDGTTPPSIAPGSPAGSYALSGFDTVDLYSGKLNIAIALHAIGGRGEAGYTVGASIQRNWNVTQLDNGDGTVSYMPETGMEPNNGFIGNTPVTYLSPGQLTFRSIPDTGNSSALTCTGGALSGGTIVNPGGYTLTRLTWTGADGTETELVDAQSGGQEEVQPWGCGGSGNGQPQGTGYSRGTVFVATDGSGITFVSSAPIYDSIWYAGYSSGVSNLSATAVAGWLFLPNGTRYTIISGDVSQIRDRNGNQLNICEAGWIGCTGYSATDPLSRATTFTYATFPNNATTASDTIGFTGFI